ncbi:melatonin receptor type 1B-B-like [Paramacrobiotus metropolitanus]|uniref:melatonin receptor type 1B-B-like n=1 Tax=Paramacrobiotus metropolitanus TaxID=2943436 RepID=UPI00244631C6|nr:melatonin receptor type 1B-B-like [Paramacrobiotus metropolitanus]
MLAVPHMWGSPNPQKIANFSDQVVNTSFSGSGNLSGQNMPEEEPYLYLEHNFGWMIVTAIVIGAAAVIGTLGNLLIVVAVCLVKPLRTSGNVFVVNLALADIVVTAFIDPFNVVGAVAGRKVLISNSVLCDWIASFCAPACMSSMWNMCAISLNRYVLICKPHLYNRIFTFRNSILCCVCIWIGAHLFHIPNHLGWGKNRFNADYYLCTFDIVTHSYAIFYIIMGVLVPLVGVLYGYTCIFLKVRSVKTQLRQHQQAVLTAPAANASQGHPTERRDSFPEKSPPDAEKATATEHRLRRPKRPGFTQDDVKLAKTLFAAFLVFLICWLFFALFVLAHQPSPIPGWLYVLAIVMAHGNSAVNPILYGMTNEKFRDGYRNVLGLTKKSVAPTEGIGNTRGTAIVSGNFTVNSHGNSGPASEHSRMRLGSMRHNSMGDT